jgi:hypothetical protein
LAVNDTQSVKRRKKSGAPARASDGSGFKRQIPESPHRPPPDLSKAT